MIPEIERREVKLFRTIFHYALCHECKCWVRSSIGQPGWEEITNRENAIDYHLRKHHEEA